MTRACKSCGNPFEVPYPSARRQYCSPACHVKKRRKRSDAGTTKARRVPVTCPCGEVFEVPASEHARRPRTYCSIGCVNTHAPHGRHAQPDKKTLAKDGYVWIYMPKADRPPGWTGNRYPEHRQVMRNRLGRDLLPGENVHHINGVRSDNRPENLELWVTSQPKGQRVEDAVAWAREILNRYGDGC